MITKVLLTLVVVVVLGLSLNKLWASKYNYPRDLCFLFYGEAGESPPKRIQARVNQDGEIEIYVGYGSPIGVFLVEVKGE